VSDEVSFFTALDGANIQGATCQSSSQATQFHVSSGIVSLQNVQLISSSVRFVGVAGSFSGTLKVVASNVYLDNATFLSGDRGGLGPAQLADGCTMINNRGAGGAHGGDTLSGNPYTSYYQKGCGDMIAPALLGSGGAGAHQYSPSSGGRGGGALHIITNDIRIDGNISVNGGTGGTYSRSVSYYGAGGGAGGSIWLEASGSIGGAGILQANGGSGGFGGGSYYGGGGSGGRIAVTGSSSTFTGKMEAYGGIVGTGPAGTIFKNISGMLELIVDNNGLTVSAAAVTPLLCTNCSEVVFTKVVVTGASRVEMGSTPRQVCCRC